MKKRFLLSFLVLFILGACTNTDKIKVEEEVETVKKYEFFDGFDNNDNNWLVKEDEMSSISIEEGSYIIKSYDNNQILQTQYRYDFEQGKVYGTEAKIRFNSGHVDSSYGMFVENEAGEQIIFEVNNDQMIRLMSQLGTNSNVILPWTTAPLVLKDKYNQFDFLYDGSKGIFFLNKYEVASFEIAKDKLTRIGFIIRGEIEVEVDYIQLGEANSF